MIQLHLNLLTYFGVCVCVLVSGVPGIPFFYDWVPLSLWGGGTQTPGAVSCTILDYICLGYVQRLTYRSHRWLREENIIYTYVRLQLIQLKHQRRRFHINRERISTDRPKHQIRQKHIIALLKTQGMITIWERLKNMAINSVAWNFFWEFVALRSGPFFNMVIFLIYKFLRKADSYREPNHELILKYRVLTFGHKITWHTLVKWSMSINQSCQ